MKKGIFRLLLALFLVGVVYMRTDGFSPALVQGTLLSQKSALFPSEMRGVLSQTFHYLDKGRQCFVFESADGKHVLKLFNQNYLKCPWYAFLLPKEKMKRAQRRFFYEQSYKIAFHEFGEEILYLHLGPSDSSLPCVTLIDKGSRTHHLDLNITSFVLQKKGIPFYEALQVIHEQEGLPGLKREIDGFLNAIALRISKQIADDDQDVEHNWGYVDGHLFHLDPGRLYYDSHLQEADRLRKEWHSATYKFHRWLKREYPEAAHFLEARLSNL